MLHIIQCRTIAFVPSSNLHASPRNTLYPLCIKKHIPLIPNTARLTPTSHNQHHETKDSYFKVRTSKHCEMPSTNTNKLSLPMEDFTRCRTSIAAVYGECEQYPLSEAEEAREHQDHESRRQRRRRVIWARKLALGVFSWVFLSIFVAFLVSQYLKMNSRRLSDFEQVRRDNPNHPFFANGGF